MALVALALVGVLAYAAGPGRAAYRSSQARAALERAASDFCACAVGKPTGDAEDTVGRIRAAILLGADVGRGAWPQRCKPYYQVASDAYEDAARLGIVSQKLPDVDAVAQDPRELAHAVRSLSAFWLDDPEPTVPLPPPPMSSLVDLAALTPLLDATRGLVDATRDHGSLSIVFGSHDVPPISRCTIDPSLAATCTPIDDTTRMPLDTEPGARQLYTLGDLGKGAGAVTIVDETGKTIASTDRNFAWGRSLKNGRWLALEGQFITEHDGKQVRRSALSYPFSRSNQILGGWMVFKGHPWNADDFNAPEPVGYPLSVVNLALGPSAKPIELSASEPRPPNRYLFPRTYGRCIADALFADMDPKLAVGAPDGTWKLHSFDWPSVGRSLNCSGDAAIVVDWFPLTVQRCNATQCTNVPLGDYHGDLQDEFAADEHTLYALRVLDNVAFLTIVPLAHPEQRKTVAVASGVQRLLRGDTDVASTVNVVGGAAVLLFQGLGERGEFAWNQPARLYGVAVKPDGTVASALSKRGANASP